MMNLVEVGPRELQCPAGQDRHGLGLSERARVALGLRPAEGRTGSTDLTRRAAGARPRPHARPTSTRLIILPSQLLRSRRHGLTCFCQHQTAARGSQPSFPRLREK